MAKCLLQRCPKTLWWPNYCSTLVSVAKQGHQPRESQEVKEARAPQARQAGPKRLGQRHLDSWWVKKKGPSHYRYKSVISIDVTCDL